MASIAPNAGLARVAELINNDISHVAVGTGTTTPATTDTTLVTETARVAPSNRVEASNELECRVFIPNVTLPATTEEVGWFMNGSGSVDTGELLVRATLTTPFVKGSQDLYMVLSQEINRP